MLVPRYLCKSRHSIYYFRYPLLWPYAPKASRANIKFSLETRSYRLALQLAQRLAILASNILSSPELSKMDYQEIRDYLHEHFIKERNTYKSRIQAAGQLPAHDISLLTAGQESAAQAIVTGNFDAYSQGAVSLIEKEGLSIAQNKWDTIVRHSILLTS